MLTLEEIADELAVTTGTIKRWQLQGLITGRRIDGRRAHLYHPGQSRPPDRSRRHPHATTEAVPGTRDDQHSPAARDTTTTTSPGGAV
ncbi:MAG: hypothetical protein LC790_16685 [Actinobacteria bacterium]|nr:hypothetical protein [Actinomycetota bacterium]